MEHLLKVFREILYLGAVSSILIVLILLVKKIFYKLLSPKWHYYIWVLLLVRLIIPFTPQSSLSALNLFYIGAEQLSEQTSAGRSAVSSMSEALSVNPIDAVIDANSPNSTASDNFPVANNTAETGTITGITDASNITADNSAHKQSNTFPLMTLFAYVWLSGILLLSIYTLYVNIIFAVNVIRNFKPSNSPRLKGILNECMLNVGIKRNITLYTTKRNRTPSLYASYRTKILISEEYLEQLSDQEISYIFLHELSHYKRKDITVNWVITLLQIVYFFNPLIWYAFTKLHEDCEISCDAEALKYLKEEEYQAYGTTVLKLIKLFSESNFIPATAGLWKHKANYRRRIIMISNFKRSKWTSTLLTLILILAVGVIGLTGCKKSTDLTSSNNETDLSEVQDNDNNADTTITVTPTPEVTEAPVSNGIADQNNLTQLSGLLGLSKEELISQLGDANNTVDEGGLEYTEQGIRVWFDVKGIVNQVYTDKSAVDLNGTKIGDSIDNFKTVFGDPVSDNNGNALFQSDKYYLSVFYDINSMTTYAVYILSEEAAAVPGTEAPAPASATNETGIPAEGSETAQAEAAYYGDWVINQVVAYGSAGTYSKEAAEGLIGKNMSFTADSATCFGDQPSDLEATAVNPSYETTELSVKDFMANYRMTLDKLGITKDSVTQVTAVDSEGNGCTFLMKDANTLIVIGGGTYFELLRY